MLESEYFSKDGIVGALASAKCYCADGFSFDELFNYMFNEDYYIIGMYEAAKALESYKNDEKLDGYTTDLDGIFGAIELVKQYDLDRFGEVLTALDDPEKLANMVEYIRGENLFNASLSRAGLDLSDEVTEKNILKFAAAAKEI